jgi:hypothetical protein
MPISILSGPIVRLQFASDARWEEAVHIVKDCAKDPGIALWMSTASQNVAVEAFVPVAHGLAFLGVRLSSLSRKLQYDIVTSLVLRFIESPEMCSASFIEHIESFAGCILFKTVPNFLEIGKVNAWRSFRSVKFWPNEAGQSPIESVRSTLESNARFREPSRLPYAIEFQFDGKLAHWYAQPISVSTNDVHLLNDEIILNTIAEGVNGIDAIFQNGISVQDRSGFTP